MTTGQYETYPPKTKLAKAVFCKFHLEWGLSYQKCRMCGQGLGDVEGLWKYAVRHYMCDSCREKGMSNPVGRMSKDL